MPRGRLDHRARRLDTQALRFEQLCHKTREMRRALRERQSMDSMRRATPDWVDMDAQIKQLQLEAEMDAMEACIDARRPKTPILNFDLMPGFSPPDDRLSAGLETETVTGAITRTGRPAAPPHKIGRDISGR